MIIANQLKKKNRAEYLLYLWQVEDIIRTYGCDFDKLRNGYLNLFKIEDPATAEATRQWYADLCDMMHTEGITEKGHLQICKNILQELEELHAALTKSEKFPYYRQMYYKVLPYIVELRGKNSRQEGSELQTCFDALYGIMMLRLQKKEVSEPTRKAATDISQLLGQLSDYYFKDKEHPIEF